MPYVNPYRAQQRRRGRRQDSGRSGESVPDNMEMIPDVQPRAACTMSVPPVMTLMDQGQQEQKDYPSKRVKY